MDVAFGRLEPGSGERFQRLRNDLGVSSFGMWESWDEGGPGRPPPEVPLPEDL